MAGSQKKTKDEILAKNLLEGKTCETCSFRVVEQGEVIYCGWHKSLEKRFNAKHGKPIPSENTCENWSDQQQITADKISKEQIDSIYKKVKEYQESARDYEKNIKRYLKKIDDYIDYTNITEDDVYIVQKDYEKVFKDFSKILGEWTEWYSKK